MPDQGSVRGRGHHREPRSSPAAAAAAEKSAVMRAVWAPCAGVAALGVPVHTVA